MHKQPLLQALQEILPERSLGISEFDLLRVLQQPPYSLFAQDALRDPLLLFQTHFVLFNALYQLKDLWYQQQSYCVDIVLTHIRLLPYHPGEAGLSKPDTLREYYLNWQNFSDTGKDDVTAMLDNFWRRIQGEVVKTRITSQEVIDAYATLELGEETPFMLVKQRYRKLLYLNHPDKGGETAQAQKIEQAYRLLKAHLA